MNDEEKTPKKNGPEPQRVKIEGEWEEAVKKALRKKKPEKWQEKTEPTSDSP